MTDIERLVAIENIRTLFAQRLRYMDQRQWHLYAALHTQDAVSETYSHGAPVVGADEIAAAIERYMTAGAAPVTSCHHSHEGEIEFQSDDEASGIWPMEDHLWWSDGDRVEHLHGYGHYLERYRRVDGRWLIAWRKLTRLRVDHSPGFHDRPGALD